MSESDMSSWTKHRHLLVVDGKGYVWRAFTDGTWSMAPTNPDNSPIPQPITYYAAINEPVLDEVEYLIREVRFRPVTVDELVTALTTHAPTCTCDRCRVLRPTLGHHWRPERVSS